MSRCRCRFTDIERSIDLWDDQEQAMRVALTVLVLQSATSLRLECLGRRVEHVLFQVSDFLAPRMELYP
jgi:hypothetical protein